MKKIWAIIMIVCTLLTIPSVYDKVTREKNYRSYDISLDYMSLVANNQEDDEKAFMSKNLKEMIENGLETVFLRKNSLAQLMSRGIVVAEDAKSIKEKLDIQGNIRAEALENIPDTHTLVLIQHNNEFKGSSFNNVSDLIFKSFKSKGAKQFTIDKQSWVVIPKPITKTLYQQIPFLPSDLEDIKKQGLGVIPEVSSDHPSWSVFSKSLMEEHKKKPIVALYLSSGKVVGYPKDLKDTPKELPNVPYLYQEALSVDQKQIGFSAMVPEMQKGFMRTHIFSETTWMQYGGREDEIVDRFVLAVKERNIRTIILSVPADINKKEALSNWYDAFTNTKESLEKSGYEQKPYASFEKHDKSIIHSDILLYAYSLMVFAMMYFASKRNRLFTLPLIGGFLLLVLYLITGKAVFFHVYTLCFAIAIAFNGVLMVYRVTQGDIKSHFAFAYFWIVSFVLYSATVLNTMHRDIRYSLYLEGFRGISVLLAVVPCLTVAYLAWHHVKFSWEWLKEKVVAPIRFYHLFLLIILVLGAYMYLSRSGNGGTMLPFEKEFRLFLQDVLEVRPRTKEFLIGFPALWLVLRIKNAKSLYLLPIASVGLVSVVNTFTHLHTPLIYSITRSLYSWGIGLIIGAVVYYLFTIGCKLFKGKKIK
ncbi:DUF5693 family protein [Bacillus luti]|nr:hypothetical protein [Bacillus cereus]HDR8327629.1 hypothetical protein [Bacillus cereus]HDR8334338.1 hypothetical protein [Bacillus cereus]